MAWNSDYKYGKDGEKEAKGVFSRYFEELPEDSPTQIQEQYDFMHENIKYEVKKDRKTYKTEKVAVELYKTGELSGLSVTKADYYIFVLPYPSSTAYKIIETKKLKTLAMNESTRTVWGGDNDNVCMALVPVAFLSLCSEDLDVFLRKIKKVLEK